MTSLQDTANRKRADLRALLVHRFGRLQTLESIVRRHLSSMPFGEQQLRRARDLLGLHTKLVRSLRCLLRDVPDSRHEALLRDWWRLMSKGEEGLAQLGAQAANGRRAKEFKAAARRFDIATTLQECEQALHALEVAVRKVRRGIRTRAEALPRLGPLAH